MKFEYEIDTNEVTQLYIDALELHARQLLQGLVMRQLMNPVPFWMGAVAQPQPFQGNPFFQGSPFLNATGRTKLFDDPAFAEKVKALIEDQLRAAERTRKEQEAAGMHPNFKYGFQSGPNWRS